MTQAVDTIDARTKRAEAMRESRRAHILHTALEVFATNGYHQTRVSDIIEAAGIARGTFYLYFESKSAIFLELLEQRQLIHDEFAGQKLVVVATADGSGARAFDSGDLEFEVLDLEAGVLRSEDGRSWRITETALVADDGALLSRLPGHNSFWFAVTNHHPDSRLFEG